MRNINILVRNYIMCSIGSLRGKKKARKGSAGVSLIVLLFVGLGALIAFEAWSFGFTTKHFAEEAGVVPDYTGLLFMGLAVGLVLVLFFAMQNITGGSKANDADLLLSMPISKIEIITAKAVSKYLIYFAMNALFSFGFFLMYLVFSGFSLAVLAAYLIIILLVPALAVGVNYILDYLTTVLFGKFGAASIFRTVFSLAVLCAFLGVWIYMQIGMNPAIGNAGPPMFPPISWFLDFAVSFDLLSLLWILYLCVLPFVLGIVLMATTLGKVNTSAKRKAVNIGAQRSRSPLMNVFLKELRVYINTPILMINTLVGVILMIGATVWIALTRGSAVAGLLASFGLPAATGVAFGVTVLFCLLSALVFISCSSISLEGKSFWVIKTMPIDARAVLIGKTLLNIVLVSPVIAAASIVMLFALELGALEFVVMLVLPILVNIFISFGGLYINLLFPKFDWESEQAVVKQSMSVILTTLLGLVVALVPILAAVVFGLGNMLLLSLVCAGLLGALAAGSVVLTLTRGKTIYERL